jgi:hypothetical protein
MGFTLRSVPLSKGTRGVTTRMTPHTVSPVGAPAAVAVGRPNRPRFLGFNPPESPSQPDEGLVRRPPDAPLGFRPSRVLLRKPCSGFPPNSSHALYASSDESPDAPAPQSIYRLPAGLVRVPHRSTFRGQDNPSGFSHRLDPAHSSESASGLCIRLTLCRALLPTSQRS